MFSKESGKVVVIWIKSEDEINDCYFVEMCDLLLTGTSDIFKLWRLRSKSRSYVK
jgi:hypothetical protein